MKNDSQAELISRIEKALDSIRPYLLSDGGDVKLHGIDETGIVEVELLGSCENCGMNSMTMKAGIEEAIRKAAPEIKGVKEINSLV